MTDSDGRYDVIIIGSGAGGGTLARHLAPSGKRILILERGDWLPREAANWDSKEVFVENRYVPNETWYDDKDKPFQPGIHYAVGGATKLYGAALYRLRPEDFGEIRHHGGVSPAWPISYDDFEPYYTRAEHLYEVHGNHGEDPTEGHASAQYAYPAVRHEPRIQQLADDLERAGYHPFHAPCGVRLLEDDMPNSRCIRCQTCDGFPCLVQAKSDAEMLGVRPALEHPNVTIRTRTTVLRLETNAAGSGVERVVAERAGVQETYDADLVVISAGAANSAKILLASASDRHPNGLANGSGMVGRNYMFHNSTAVLAISKEPNPTMFQKTLGLNDFYFGMKDFTYPMGNIQMVGKSDAEMFKGEKPLQTKLAPMFSLTDVAIHAVDFWLSSEDLPEPDNRVTLTKDGAIRLTYTPEQRGTQGTALPSAQVDARPPRHASRPSPATDRLSQERDPDRRGGPPGRDGPVRDRPRDLRPERGLPGARSRQPVCRRHQLLPEHRCREPGTDGDGQRPPGR